MESHDPPEPTERELRILRVLWDRGEATVREIHDALRADLDIVQNTVQAFLRTMTEKGLVAFREEKRAFVYRAVAEPGPTRQRLAHGFLQRAFDGAIDEFVASAVSVRTPSQAELARLRELLDRVDGEGAAP